MSSYLFIYLFTCLFIYFILLLLLLFQNPDDVCSSLGLCTSSTRNKLQSYGLKKKTKVGGGQGFMK